MVALNSNNVPPDHIIEWCRQLVDTIRDGGVWGIPRSGLAFRVDHKNKRLVLSAGEKEHGDFYATQHHFSFIGWAVVTEDEINDTKIGPT
jgi:hypothetical protein